MYKRQAEIKLQKNEKGVVYTRFPLAISRGKNKDGENRGTDFPMITVFEKQAENLQKYSGKGKRAVSYTHLDVYKRQGDISDIGILVELQYQAESKVLDPEINIQDITESDIEKSRHNFKYKKSNFKKKRFYPSTENELSLIHI